MVAISLSPHPTLSRRAILSEIRAAASFINSSLAHFPEIVMIAIHEQEALAEIGERHG
jgi:hypothetical protein